MNAVAQKFIVAYRQPGTTVWAEVHQESEDSFSVTLLDREAGERLPTSFHFRDRISAEFKALELADRKPIVVTERIAGYAHTKLSGVCGPNVSVADIEREMYHLYFGGREAWVRDQKWGCVRHDD